MLDGNEKFFYVYCRSIICHMTQLLTTFVEFSIDTAKSAIFTSHVIAAAIGPVVLALYDIVSHF